MQYADRVQETTTTTGTGTLSLGGAVSGYRTFASAFSASDTVRYAIAAGTEWEVGEGVYSASTLTRVTVFASSNAGALVSFSAGTKNVWSDIPAAALSALGTATTDALLVRSSAGHVAASSVATCSDSGQQLVVTANAQSTLIQLTNYAASALGSNVMCRKARGTSASPTRALSGDALGGFFARGYFDDGATGFGPSTANAVRIVAEEDYTSTAQGAAYVIAVSKIGAITAPEVWRVNGHGFMTVTCKTASAGSVGVATWTAAAHTAQTASTELNDFKFDCSAALQFSTGALTTQRQVLFKARTYTAVGASTITNAATVAIDKAPVASTNVTITNPYAFWVQAGTSKFDGGISTSGLTVTGSSFVVWNPAGTFNVTVAVDALVSNRVVTIPLTTTDDYFTLNDFPATLTNKTIDGAVNTVRNVTDYGMLLASHGSWLPT